MLTYGFFNSQDGDRTYTAADFNKYFDGVISQNGIFQAVGDAFQVTADTSQLRVAVGSGKALVNSHWADNSETAYLTLSAADVALDRWDQIVLRCSETNRNIELAVNTGTPSSTQPANIYTVTRTPTTYEILLAVVKVPKASTKVTTANITDTRANTSVCGYITGLVKQVDTSELFLQWQTAVEEMEAEMTTWENAQKAAMTEWENTQKETFNTWLNTLTDELTVNIHVERLSGSVTTTDSTRSVNMPADIIMQLSEADIIDVYLNGVYLIPMTEYIILYQYDINMVLITAQVQFIKPIDAGNTVTFNIIKSVIG